MLFVDAVRGCRSGAWLVVVVEVALGQALAAASTDLTMLW
jgi:hypothetical protein